MIVAIARCQSGSAAAAAGASAGITGEDMGVSAGLAVD